MIEGRNATIIEHSRYGTRRIEAASFRASDAAPYAQHPVSVMVSVTEPQRRNGTYFRIVPGDHRYILVERDGAVINDSRKDVT